jgi:lipid-binding SYLF domain-containing protein
MQIKMMSRLLLCVTVALGGMNVSFANDDNFLPRTVTADEANAKISSASAVLEEMTAASDKGIIPAELLKKAGAIAVIPDVIEAGLVIAAKLGRGVLVIREPDGSWSNPVFVNIEGGSWGLQAGAQSSDIILVFQNRKAVDNMINSSFKLSAKAGVAAGPIGRTAEAGVNLKFESPIYSYSRSSGLFAGISLEGSVMEIDHAANKGLYGKGTKEVSVQDVFSGKVIAKSKQIERLHGSLHDYIAPAE